MPRAPRPSRTGGAVIGAGFAAALAPLPAQAIIIINGAPAQFSLAIEIDPEAATCCPGLTDRLVLGEPQNTADRTLIGVDILLDSELFIDTEQDIADLVAVISFAGEPLLDIDLSGEPAPDSPVAFDGSAAISPGDFAALERFLLDPAVQLDLELEVVPLRGAVSARIDPQPSPGLTWSGDVTVRYAFEGAAVPIPATIALTAAALAALGGVAARRRRG